MRPWLVTYQDGPFPSDDGGGSGPIGLAYFERATGAVIGVDSPTGTSANLPEQRRTEMDQL